jgi:hypothetical protein
VARPIRPAASTADRDDPDHALTPRLQLDAVVPEDLDEHYALLSDPGVWAHLPSGVHTDRGRTANGVARVSALA